MDFIYNYNKPNYNTIMKSINKIKNDYHKEEKSLISEYQKILLQFDCSKYQQLLLYKKNMDLKYILKIIAIFKPILKNSVTIFLHGSYARNLNRWNSDIDLNILYKNTLKPKYLVVEEFIQALIYQMLEFKGRDRIHNIMVYYPLLENKTYKIKANNHRIICQKDIFSFCCRHNYNHIYPLVLNSFRDPKNLYNWIMQTEEDDENQYSFQGLNFKGRVFVHKLTKQKSLQQTINNLHKLITKTIHDISNVQNIENAMLLSDLNKIIKITNFHNINNFLLCLKEYIFLKKGKCYYLDFYKIIHHKIIRQEFTPKELFELEYLLTKYRFVIDRIENLFMNLNINFSSREKKQINMQTINKSYKDKYQVTFMDDYLIIFQVYDIITTFLQQITSNLNLV